MSEIKENKKREYRINMGIVVDAYDSGERAMGWYCYVSDNCEFPFDAKCISEREISPLNSNDKVRVFGTASTDECENEIFVKIEWNNREFAVPLSQLKGLKVDKDTRQVIEDWHYWVNRGYIF